jgi:hypothetical protein
LPSGGTIEVANSTSPTFPVIGWLFHIVSLPGVNNGDALVMGTKLHVERDNQPSP